MINERTDKVYVNSQNVQNALNSFINRHRNNLQKLMEQNNKLAQQNSVLSVHLNEQEGTILALNERISKGEKEIANYKEEQARLLENKKLLRSELMAYKQRCSELMIGSEKEKEELQQKIDKLQKELNERDDKETELKNELDVIRQELQAKQAECEESNGELSKVKPEINECKQQLVELEKSIVNLREEIKQKDETINKMRQEQVDYKVETEKNISKMQEIQRIFYPNASNPLPQTRQSNSMRSTLPASVSVQPRPQSRTLLKRSSSTSSLSDSDSDNVNDTLLRGWQPPRNGNMSGTEQRNVTTERGSTDIPATPERSQQPRRKRYRH